VTTPRRIRMAGWRPDYKGDYSALLLPVRFVAPALADIVSISVICVL
jgi:hypothetical protein